MPKVETFDKDLAIENALSVFHTKGYNLTSMQDLVDATGLNRSSIYNSFGSKLALYKLCLKAYQTASHNTLEETISNINCAFSKLKAIFKLGVSSNKEYLEKGCLFNNCASEMANQEATINIFLSNNKDKMLSFFNTIILEGQAKGFINANRTSEDYARYLLNAFQGLRISGILMSEQELDNIVVTTLSILK